jgi:uncharacterized protein YjdB
MVARSLHGLAFCAACTLLTALALGCENATEPHVASVLLSPSSISLYVGSTSKLTATPVDAGGNVLTGRRVAWETSSATVATVDSAGLVTAVAAGSATITATIDGASGMAAVTVHVSVASVTISPASLTLNVGSSSRLTATPRDAGGNALTGRSVAWQTSSATVATVDSAGLVTAVAAGSATITATIEGKSGSAAVTVGSPAPVASVTVSPAALTLSVGAAVLLTATPLDSSGNELYGRIVAWQSSAPAVAAVDTSGRVRALVTGNATIAATVEGKTGSAAVTIVPAAVNSLPVLRYDGTRWTPGAATTVSLASVWGASDSVVYAAGQWNHQGIVVRYDGTTWSQVVQCEGQYGSSATSVWGSSAMDVYAACTFAITPPFFGYYLIHYDGRQWSQVSRGGCSFCDLMAGWSGGTADVFVVKGFGIDHFDGASWTAQALSNGAFLRGVWGFSSGGPVFAVGNDGAIFHFDRSTWVGQTSGTSQHLYAVWGASASDVFAVGAGGTILHYDGKTWSPQVSGATQTLYGVWGSSGTDVFAVGNAGTILHFDGTSWTAQSGASISLWGVWESSPTNVFAVGGAP